MNKVLDWPYWEKIMQLVLVVLFVYVAYELLTNPSSRSLTNVLLLLIGVAVSVQIHQNINLQKGLLNNQ
jgi:hypothetical protein